MSVKELNSRIANLESMVAKLLEKVGATQVEPLCNYTLHSWLDEWLKVFKAPNVQPYTLYTLSVAIRVHIKPNFADIPLNLVSGLELQKLLMGIEKSRTRRNVRDILNGCFREAIALKLIRDNPMLAVKIPTHIHKGGKPLTANEVDSFKLAIKGKSLESLFLFLLYSGCRRGEALALNIRDVDIKNKLIHIRGTKTKTSNRIIPLFQNVHDLLLTLKADKNGFYFKTDPRWVTRSFKKCCPNHKLHDLRHTFATQCLEAKIPLKVVQIWLGHAELDTTANIYSHVSNELATAEAEAFDLYQKKKAP